MEKNRWPLDIYIQILFKIERYNCEKIEAINPLNKLPMQRKDSSDGTQDDIDEFQVFLRPLFQRIFKRE